MARRTFSKPDEYRSLEGFVEDNPVDAAVYRGVVGDYKHPEYKERCCFRKENGKLCRREHNFGYVVQLVDGTFSIIGNQCAQTRFDADSELRIDIRRFIEKRDREMALVSIRDLLDRQEEVLAPVFQELDRAERTKQRVLEFEDRVGRQLVDKLKDMSRRQATDVVVTGVSVHKHIDEDGKEERETRTVPIAVGRLRGLSVFSRFHAFNTRSKKSSIEWTFSEAHRANEDLSAKDLKGILNELRGFEAIQQQATELCGRADRFFESDIATMAFLTTDRRYKFEPVRFYLEATGQAHSKDKARQWLQDAIEVLKRSNNVQKIRV